MNEKTSSPKALTETAKLAALTVVLAVFSLLIPFFWFITLAIIPIPITVITVKWGAKYGSLASIATGVILTILTGPAEGIPVFLIIILLGVGQGIAIQKEYSPATVLLIGAVAVAASLVLMGLLVYFLQGINLITEQAKMADQFLKIQQDLYIKSGLTKQEAQTQLKQVKELFSYAPMLIPSGVVIFSLWVSTLSELLTFTILKRLKLKAFVFPPFKEWQFPWIFAWGFIIGLTCGLFYPQIQAYSRVILIIGLNFLLVFTVIYLVQGLSIVAFYLDKYKAPAGMKLLVYTIAVFLQLMFQGLTWFGLLDTWFNFRKLKPKT